LDAVVIPGPADDTEIQARDLFALSGGEVQAKAHDIDILNIVEGKPNRPTHLFSGTGTEHNQPSHQQTEQHFFHGHLVSRVKTGLREPRKPGRKP